MSQNMTIICKIMIITTSLCYGPGFACHIDDMLHAVLSIQGGITQRTDPLLSQVGFSYRIFKEEWKCYYYSCIKTVDMLPLYTERLYAVVT